MLLHIVSVCPMFRRCRGLKRYIAISSFSAQYAQYLYNMSLTLNSSTITRDSEAETVRVCVRALRGCLCEGKCRSSAVRQEAPHQLVTAVVLQHIFQGVPECWHSECTRRQPANRGLVNIARNTAVVVKACPLLFSGSRIGWAPSDDVRFQLACKRAARVEKKAGLLTLLSQVLQVTHESSMP